MSVLSFLPLMSNYVKFEAYLEAYLEAICGDGSFQLRRQSYVPTDLLDRQRQKHSPIEQPDFFAEFAAFDLNLNVQTVRKDKPTQDLEPEKAEPEKAEIERLPVLEGIRKYAERHVLLVGRPGSGKSTALERLLLQEAEIAQENPQAEIPVLLKLRDLRSTVIDLVQRSLENRGLGLEQAEILELLKTGRFLLLWDGVNELPNDDALKELTELRQRYRHTPMIFTTRTLSVGSDLGIEKKLEMQPLSEPQMRQFACTYLGDEKGSRLIGQLGQRLREFGETPLLLWMLCWIYSKAGQIPQNLGSVFQKFAEIYDDKKEFDEKVRSWRLRFLRALAFAMMPQGDPKGLRLSMLKSEAVDLFVELLKQDDEVNRRDRAIGYLDDLLRHHLLQPKNHSEIEFRHQLFQEYFAAEYLRRQLKKPDDLTLQKLYLNSLDWTESLALMLGILDDERQALQVVRLALEVDLKLGARLAGAVLPKFQEQTVGWVIGLDVSEWLKIHLLGETRSGEAVSKLIDSLDHQDYNTQSLAVTALERIGSEKAVEELLNTLEREDLNISIRLHIANVLGRIGKDGTSKLLIQILQSEKLGKYCNVRWLAAIALGQINDKWAIDPLLEALDHGETHIRSGVVAVLKENDDDKAIKGLGQAIFQDEISWIRSNALWALGQISNDQAVEVFLQVSLHHNDFNLQQRAVLLLEKIATNKAIESLHWIVLLSQSLTIRWYATVALLKINDVNQTTKWLIQLLMHKPSHRYLAAEALGRIGDVRAVEPLLQSLEDNDPQVRWYVASALEKIGDIRAVQRLLQTLKEDSDPNVQFYVVRALGKTRSDKATKPLLQVLKNGNSDLRWNAAYALGELTSEGAINGLIEALQKDEARVRASAASALGKIGSPEAVEALMQALDYEESFVRQSAAEALGKIATPQLLVQLWQLCRSGNREAFSPISAIQERCRFYNYEIEQMALPAGAPANTAPVINNFNISGGEFKDFVAGDKTIEVKRDYVENQENTN